MAIRFNYSVSVNRRKGGRTVVHSKRRRGLWRGVLGGVLGLGSAIVLAAVILPLAFAVVVGGVLMLAGLGVMTALAGGNRARLSRGSGACCPPRSAPEDGQTIDAEFTVLGEDEGASDSAADRPAGGSS